MNKSISPISSFYNNYSFRVSELSLYSFCPKRSYLTIFHKGSLNYTDYTSKNQYMAKGTQMHQSYSSWVKSFDRLKVLYDLKYSVPLPYTRNLDNIQIRGIFDDIRVIRDFSDNKKYVSFIELKTTHRKRLWSNEINSAIFQLQLYLWIMKPYLDKLGYKLHIRHYLEIYSQVTNKLLKRIIVTEDKDIEDRIRDIVKVFFKEKAMQYPKKYLCKRCPKIIRERCSYGSSK